MTTVRRGPAALKGVTGKDHKHLLRDLLDRGFDVQQRKAGHLKVVAPDGEGYFTGVTPGGSSGTRNLRAWAKRKERR